MTNSSPSRRNRSWRVSLLAQDGWAMLAIGVATVVAQLGMFFLSQALGVERHSAMLAAVAFGALWTLLAAPVVASASSSSPGMLARAAAVCDSSIVLLIVLWGVCPNVHFMTAVKIYCIYAAVALAGSGMVTLGRTLASRRAIAVVAAAVLAGMTLTPLWACGAAQRLPAGGWTLAAAVYVNPVYALWAIDPISYTWHQSGMMYELSPIRSLGPPSALWYAPVAIYMAMAAAFWTLGLLVRRPPITGPAERPGG